MMKILIGLTILLFGIQSNALIDPENASFTDTQVDMIVLGTGYNLRIQRSYSSRSIHSGIFGFGQCSDFETSLQATPEGSIIITHCGAGQITEFLPKGKSANTAKAVEMILEEKKKKSPNPNPKYWSEFKEKLLFDEVTRRREALELGINTKLPEGDTLFLAGGSGSEQVAFKNNTYIRYLNDSTVQIFNPKGELIKMSDRNGNSITIERKDGKISRVLDDLGRSLTFVYHPNTRLVKDIIGPDGIKATYEYKDKSGENLTKVVNAWGNAYLYEYDELHNQTRKAYPDKTQQTLTYDKKRDWVTSFKNRSGCLESYNYEFDKKQPELHYWANVKKVCKGKVVASNKYEFWFKKDNAGKGVLQKTRSKENNRVTEIIFDESNGRPLVVNTDGSKVEYAYFPNGLLQAKKTPNQKSTYTYYDEIKKVKTMVVDILDPKGKVLKTVTTQFKYDNKANLQLAENSDGQRVKLTPDAKGRVKRIEDQAKRVLSIEYDERFNNKPKLIKREGLGSLTIAYKPNGDIDRVDSKESPEVAQQIASTFNNLLDIVGPASTDVSL